MTAPSAPPEDGKCGGERMERSLADFERACAVYIDDEQQCAAPDNALIALLCDAVRLSREYAALTTARKDLSASGPKGSSTDGPKGSDDGWTQTAYCADHELWWNGPYKCCPVCHLAKALPSRETLIEECAQEADVIAERMDRRTFPSAGRTAHDIAAAIRQLKGGGQ